MIKQFILLILFAGFFGLIGCSQRQGLPIKYEFQYYVFECEKSVLDKLIPEKRIHTISDSVYLLSTISSNELNTLLESTTVQPGLLRMNSRLVSWPKIADAWSYSVADNILLGSGGGAGFLGVNNKFEIYIEYNVTHGINQLKQIESKIFYEGMPPKQDALIFFSPYKRTDGVERYHVIIFRIDDWEREID